MEFTPGSGLVERVRRLVLRRARFQYGLPEDVAEDIAQEILILLWKTNPDREPGVVWLLRATHYRCQMAYRAEQRRRARELEFTRRYSRDNTAAAVLAESRIEYGETLRVLAMKDVTEPVLATTIRGLAEKLGIERRTLYERVRRLRKDRPSVRKT